MPRRSTFSWGWVWPLLIVILSMIILDKYYLPGSDMVAITKKAALSIALALVYFGVTALVASYRRNE